MARGAAASRLAEVLELTINSNNELRAALDQYDATSRKGIDLVNSDVGLVDALVQSEAGPARARLSTALDAFESARRDLRVAAMELAAEEGATLADLAGALGLSRQLLSRLARETRMDRGRSNGDPI